MPRLQLNVTRSRMTGSRRCRSPQRGVAAVEFALVLLPLVLIAFGAAEYGRAIYQYNTLVKSARTAVRMLSQFDPGQLGYRDPLPNESTTQVQRAKCYAAYGNENCEGTALAPSLTVANVHVCDSNNWDECPGASATTYSNVSTGQGTIDLVAVRITGYAYPFIGLPLVTNAPTLTFSDIEAVMRQRG